MRNLLALAAAAVIAFVVVGYFQGWYAVKRTTDSSGSHYEVDVNSPKISEDISKAKEKARTWLSQSNPSGNTTAPQQVIRPTPPELPSGTPTSFTTTSDGTIVFPSIPLPPPAQNSPITTPPISAPPGLPQR